MRSKIETLLLSEVEPRLRATIPKMVPTAGADDPGKLLQDGIVIAIQLWRRTRKASKNVTGGNLAHYTLLHLWAGRRSTGYRKSDVMHPASQLNGHSQVYSMDAPIGEDDNGQEALTLHDCLAAPVDTRPPQQPGAWIGHRSSPRWTGPRKPS